MKSRSRLVRRLLLGVVATGCVIATAYADRHAPLAFCVIGSWTDENADDVTVTTFHPSGDWELVTTFKPNSPCAAGCADGSSLNVPIVYKGRYETSGSTFRVLDVVHYLRINSQDVKWEPCRDCVRNKGQCITDAEIIQLDRQAFSPDQSSTIIAADWWTGTMTLRDSPSGLTNVWKR